MSTTNGTATVPVPGEGSTAEPVNGDPESRARLEDRFDHLFQQNFRKIHRYFRRKGFEIERARELAQDVFCRAYRGLANFRDEAKESTWLFTIAKNLASNERRRWRTLKRGADEVGVDPEILDGTIGAPPVGSRKGGKPLENLLDAERRRALRQAMEELPPQMRRSVVLRVEQGLKYREIAEVMDVSIDTVKSQLHQAKKRLRETLGQRFEGLDGAGDG